MLETKRKILKAPREVMHYVQRILNDKINSWFLIRNNSGQKAVG